MNKRRIPKKDIVISIAEKILKQRGTIFSLNEYCFLVTERIRCLNPKFVLSTLRLKRLVLGIPEIEIKTSTRRSHRSSKIIKECPVCGHGINKVKGRNLFGRKIVVGYDCKQCGFSSDAESFIPMKYVFIWKKIETMA